MKVKDLFFGFVTSADILVGAVVNEEVLYCKMKIY
jgi:hypothetical protein